MIYGFEITVLTHCICFMSSSIRRFLQSLSSWFRFFQYFSKKYLSHHFMIISFSKKYSLYTILVSFLLRLCMLMILSAHFVTITSHLSHLIFTSVFLVHSIIVVRLDLRFFSIFAYQGFFSIHLTQISLLPNRFLFSSMYFHVDK